MSRRRFGAVGLAVFTGLILASAASAEVYTIDPVHSGVNFKVKHFFTLVPGQFTSFSGTIDYDPADVTKSKVDVSIDAKSISTNNQKRDDHLRSEDFLAVEKHPTITFQSTKVAKKGDSQLLVDGNLTIRGVTKPVTLTVDLLGMGPGMQGDQRAGFNATTKINRQDFEVKWNRALDSGGFLLGDDVQIEIPVEAIKKTT